MMDKKILECILKKNWKDSKIENVVSAEIVPAVGKFVNKSADVNRLNLKVILRNGRTVKRSLLIKKVPTDQYSAWFNKRWNSFKNETMMYGLFKEIEFLMEEFQDSEDVPWCQMIHHIPYSCIIMEDLKAKGYYMIAKEDLLDLEHSMLAIHTLGRYHGFCKILEERGLLSSQGFGPWCLFDYYVQLYTYSYIGSLVEGIKKLWDPSWTPIVDKIKMTKESFGQRLKELGEVDETKFNLLNHGDCNKNNFLFKYDCDKRPIGIRFIDFQMVHYGSPCLDLTQFIYQALQPSVRHVNLDLIMKTYHNSLSNTLEKFQYKGNKPNFDEIIDGMNKYSFIGLAIFLSNYPNLFMTEKMNQQQDLAKMVASEGKEGYPEELFKPDLLEDEMGPDLKAFVKLFF